MVGLYSWRIVGWATCDRLKKGLAFKALSQAILMREPPAGLIHHSDCGNQYCSDDYRRLLQSQGLSASMSGKVNCYDYAMVETVFKTIKTELIWRASYETRAQATLAFGHYVDGFNNPRRRHSALCNKSPIAFEAKMAEES